MIASGKPADAVDLLEEIETTEYAFLRFGPLFDYMKAVGYGRTERYGEAYDALYVAETEFMRRANYRRIAELAVYRLEFALAQGSPVPDAVNADLLQILHPSFADRYHLLRASAGIDPVGETSVISDSSPLRRAALFICGKHHLATGDKEAVETCLKMIRQMKNPSSGLDYAGWLEVLKDGNDIAQKDFLIAEVLPHAEATTDLLMMRRATDDIVSVLIRHKRYKDAMQYKLKMEKYVRRIARRRDDGANDCDAEEDRDPSIAE
jgi:hypothetical protein